MNHTSLLWTWQERAEYAGIKRAHERHELCRLLGDGNVTKGLIRLLRAEQHDDEHGLDAIHDGVQWALGAFVSNSVLVFGATDCKRSVLRCFRRSSSARSTSRGSPLQRRSTLASSVTGASTSLTCRLMVKCTQ